MHFDQVGHAFADARIDLLLLAIPILIVERVVRPYRLYVLLGANGSLRDIFSLQNVALLVNLVLPMRSGEIFLVVALRSLGYASGSFALSIVAIDRLLDVTALLLIFAVSVAMVPELPAFVRQAVIVPSVGSVGLLALMIGLAFARGRVLSEAGEFLARRIGPKRAAPWLSRFRQLIEGFAVLLDPPKLVRAALATTMTWACAITAAYFVLIALWPQAPLSAAALSICLGVFGVILVSVPAGIGILHAAFAFGALASGATREVSLAFAILEYFIPTTVTIAMGLVGLPVARRAGIKLFSLRSVGPGGFWIEVQRVYEN
jgi:uncharacterized protein (TIRG00374 family)